MRSDGRLPRLEERDVNRGERRDGVRGYGDIVAAHHGAIFRHPEPPLVQRAQDA
jgi:hypothetical protein